jgi:hypothetical protein
MSHGQPQSFSSQLDVLKICVYLPNYRQNLMVSLDEYPRGYTDAAAAPIPIRTPDPGAPCYHVESCAKLHLWTVKQIDPSRSLASFR